MVGQNYVQQSDAPEWIAVAAHRSGISLPETVHLYHELAERLSQHEIPETIVDWARLMIEILKTVRPYELPRILPRTPYGESSRLSGIYSTASEVHGAAWNSFERTLAAWMTGKTLIEVAAEVSTKAVNGNTGRGPQDPLPRTISVVGDGFRFGLSMIAGTLGSIVATGREEDPEGPWLISDASLRSLTLLPLAVRSGANSPEVLAWIRAGVQPRVAAHIFSGLFPLPEEQDDDLLQRWAYRRFIELLDGLIEDVPNPAHQVVLRALKAVRDAR